VFDVWELFLECLKALSLSAQNFVAFERRVLLLT
jgi:hypothetical protein